MGERRQHTGAAWLGPVVVAAALMLAAGPTGAVAKTKTLRGKIVDPVGDASAQSADITSASTQYEPATGRLRIAITTKAPLDLTKKNQLVFMFTGTACNRDLFGAAADLSDATAPWVYNVAKKSGVVGGSGTVSDTTYVAKFRTSIIAKRKPVYFQVALYPPGANRSPIDQTDCSILK